MLHQQRTSSVNRPEESLIKEFISRPWHTDRTNTMDETKGFFCPALSIVLPSYNQGQFLEKSLLSILNQGYPGLQLIVIDGGSRDNSVDIIKKYASSIDYWVSEKDQGQSDALNKGFRKATGEILGWQNSDDVYLPNAFLDMAEAFRRNPDADFVYGNRLDLNVDDDIIGETRFTKFSRLVYQYDGISLSTQSMFFRRSVLAAAGFLDTSLSFSMDYEWFLRAALRGCRFLYIPSFLGAIRRHEQAKTEAFWNSPERLQECKSVDLRYGRIAAIAIPMKIYGLLFRSMHYIFQGDGKYVLDGLLRRMRHRQLNIFSDANR
jgi:glycosyltransferase involved in cell wall biosynthesis